MKTDELIDAIQKNDAAKIGALLDEDRSLLGARAGNTSAILLAAYHGHPEIARLFVERGAELSFPEAVALGEEQRTRQMLKADPSLAKSFSDDGYPALGLAIFFRHPNLARELIERGADVNAPARNAMRVAPVHAAAGVADRETMKILLERGADPNQPQQQGVTALHGAASRGDIEMARMLIRHGADPRVKSDEGKDAAMYADEHKQPDFATWFRKEYP
jgi:ankyrin repeat protein